MRFGNCRCISTGKKAVEYGFCKEEVFIYLSFCVKETMNNHMIRGKMPMERIERGSKQEKIDNKNILDFLPGTSPGCRRAAS